MTPGFRRLAIVAMVSLTFVFSAARAASAQTIAPLGSIVSNTITFDAGALESQPAAWTPSAKTFSAPVRFDHTAPSTAVQRSSGGVGFGITFGITRTQLRADNLPSFFQGRTGWLAGIWFGGNRDGVVGFMGELNYAVRKSSNASGDVELKYLEIPMLLRINIGQRSKNGVSVYGLAGTVVDIKVSDDDLNVAHDYEGLDVGLMAGGGLEVVRVGFEVRGNWGFRSVNKGDFGNVSDIKTFTLEALVKLRIN